MANSPVSSTRKRLEKEFLLKGISAGDAIATFEKTYPYNIRKILIELLGADLTRLDLNRQLFEISKAVLQPERYMTPELFKGLTKKDALRIYTLFPRFITPPAIKPDCKEELDTLTEASNFYLSSGLWLLNWEKNSKFSDVLGQIGIEEAEKRAWVSRILYALCDYMKIHSDSPYLKSLPAPAIWLLCEISLCKNQLADKSKEGSKRKRYERMQKLYARLDSADPSDDLPTRAVEGLPDLAEHFYGYFLHLVQKMAVERPDFDQVLLSQYTKAQKVWGRKALGEKGVAAYL